MGIEGVALEVRRGAGFADDEVAPVGQLVFHWLGTRITPVAALGGPAALARVRGRWQVQVHPAAKDASFAVAHELGHWALEHVGCVRFATHAEEERAANSFAAIVLAPTRLVARAYSLFGEDLAPFAAGLCLSQTATVLRLGEVRGEDRAVVTARSHYVHVRGPTLTQERALAAAHGKVPGLVTTRLRGGIDEGRVAVRVVG